MPTRYWVETLGCPKNQVDSDKLAGTLLADGLVAGRRAPSDADLVVVNTCAFIEEARQESIDTVLALERRAPAAAPELVVTGCMAERYGDELAEALPEVDAVAGFGVPVTLGRKPGDRAPCRSFDLLNLPRPRAAAPWAYVKVAEGCDRACGFCAIPSFRGKQRSRPIDADPRRGRRSCGACARSCSSPRTWPSYGRDQGVGHGAGAIVPLVEAVRRAGRRASACSTCTRPTSRRAGRRDRAPPACRTSTSRCSTCRRRCCAACAAGATATGSSRASTTSAARARGRLPVELHRRLPGRDRGRPRPAAALRRGGPARLVRLLRLLARGRHLRRRPRRRGRRGLVAERLAELASCRTRITAARRDELIGRDGRGARGRARRRPQPPRGARDRRHRRRARPRCARRRRSRRLDASTGAAGPDLGARP